MNRSLYVVRSDVPAAAGGAADAAVLGGKGANLVALARQGLRVPRFLVLTADAFRAALDAAGVAGDVARCTATIHEATGREALAAASAEFARLVARAPLPPLVDRELSAAWEATFEADALVAVRSSAVDEDGRGGSFAGLHESRLFVRGLDALREAVRAVWASAFLERALRYRIERGIGVRNVAMAVVIQAMVDPVASGVCFTANAASGDVGEMTIAVCWGVGEGLVGAGFDADTLTVDKSDGDVQTTIAHKTERIVFDADAGCGVRREPVPPALRDAPCLDDAQRAEVVRVCLEVERAWRRPQDIEFCIDRDARLVLLQTRPITTVEEYGPAAGHALLWDNSNIVESYAGVTTPMTFSFIRRAYTVVYRSFLEVMGVPAPVIEAHRSTYANMIGLIRGRVFYNLHNWYRVVSLLPGYRFNRGFMESMMGVRSSADVPDGPANSVTVTGKLRDLGSLLRLVARSGWRFARIQHSTDRFQAQVQAEVERCRARDLYAMAPDELATLYRDLERKLLWNWKAPIVNDFYVMIAYGALRTCCARWCGDPSGALQNDLLCGEGGLDSAEPTRDLLRLASDLRADPAAAAFVRETSPEDLVRDVLRGSRLPALAARLHAHLDRFGQRCVDELKLERPTLEDDPRFLFQMLQNYIRAGSDDVVDVEALDARERTIRAAAERRVFAALGRRRLAWPKRWLFARILGAARRGVRNRENMRFSRTRIFGLVRQIVRAQGRHLVAEGLLDREDEVFYLTVDELWSYVSGTAVTARLRELAALRRAEFDAYATSETPVPDDRFTTYGMVYHRNAFRDASAIASAEDGAGLRGVPCSPGAVQGRAKVVRDPAAEAELAGEILVAQRTDPGWVPLFPSVRGLLVERGSILSHSAVVAREMGLPAIVGIPGLLARVTTGQVVAMDGSTGTVRLDAANDESRGTGGDHA